MRRSWMPPRGRLFNLTAMIGQINIKRAIKRTSNWTAILAQMFSVAAPREPRACIFYYHRIADIDFVDSKLDDRNVLPRIFEKQIAALSEFAEIVSLPELTEKIKRRAPRSKPLISLTFDDGYANFYTNALPILKRCNAPATLSIITGAVDRAAPLPSDKWAVKHRQTVSPETWKPIKWNEIEKCLASGLVTLGAHSDKHLKANDCTRAQIEEEVERSAEILYERFGKTNVPVYAYPYGNSHLGHVPEDYERAVRRAGFRLAVTTDFGLVTETLNPFMLPRIEAHGVDSAAAIRAKTASRFSPFRLHDCCRAAKYRVTNGKKIRTNIETA